MKEFEEKKIKIYTTKSSPLASEDLDISPNMVVEITERELIALGEK